MRQTGGPARSKEGYHWFRGWRKPTAAQRRVLDELVAGGTYAQIAARLGISEDGVKWHLGEVRDETGLADRRELVEWWQEERNRNGANLLFPLAALWRFASRNAVATVVVGGVVAASLAVVWLADDNLRGDDNTSAASVAPVRTPERAAAAPFVPTPTPTPAPTGGCYLMSTPAKQRFFQVNLQTGVGSIRARRLSLFSAARQLSSTRRET